MACDGAQNDGSGWSSDDNRTLEASDADEEFKSVNPLSSSLVGPPPWCKCTISGEVESFRGLTGFKEVASSNLTED